MSGKKKIEPFYIDDSMLEDPEMDEMLKKNIIEEANRIEQELNSDPSLQGVGASEDMFAMIRARLIEQGVWEEDDGQETQGTEKEAEQKKTKREEQERREKNRQERQEYGEKNRQKEREYGEKNRQEDQKCGEKNRQEEQERKEIRDQNAQGVEVQKERIQNELKWQDGMNGNNGLSEQENEKTDPYQFLSKEDREALQLGKKIKKQRKARWKQLVATVAALAIVFRVGISGEANKRWMVEVWNGFANFVGLKVRTNYSDNNNIENITHISVYSEKEQEAWNEIKEKLRVPIVVFGYLPKGMMFDNYELFLDSGKAILYYYDDEKIFTLILLTGKMEATDYFQSDTEPLLRKTIINDRDIIIKIWDTTTQNTESYMAEFEFDDCKYLLLGATDLSEFERIVKNIEII